jgi:hypothetical protein
VKRAPLPVAIEALREKANEYHRDADGWKVSPQTTEERGRLLRRVLKLHVEVVELEREIAGT